MRPAQPTRSVSSRLTASRVLELGQIYNGPYCGLLRAQLGADVIEIEPPRGEPLRFRSEQSAESHEFVMGSGSRWAELFMTVPTMRSAPR